MHSTHIKIVLRAVFRG